MRYNNKISVTTFWGLNSIHSIWFLPEEHTRTRTTSSLHLPWAGGQGRPDPKDCFTTQVFLVGTLTKERQERLDRQVTELQYTLYKYAD